MELNNKKTYRHKGTTTNSTHLKNEARNIALATKFSENQKFEEQKGTITIIFSFK